jgi:hypothetical protein
MRPPVAGVAFPMTSKNIQHFARALHVAFACATFMLSASYLASAAEQSGPTTLIITYRCATANRPAFRDAIVRAELPRFERWKRAGVIKDSHFLFSWYVDENTWDIMTILSFHQYADLARWREIERSSPGGLSQESLRLGGPANTYSADLTWHGRAPNEEGDSSKSVFFVIPYDVVNMEEYKPYVTGYVIPQADGWIKEGVLTSYSLYLNRYYAGKPWDSLLILEYKNLRSFGQRENVVAKVRAALSADAKWKALGENKKNIRIEKESVIAEELLPR